MKILLQLAFSIFLGLASTTARSQALDVETIQIDLGREYGLFSKSPAVLRAISANVENTKPKTAVLFFTGWPGILWIPEKLDPQRFLKAASRSGLYAFTKIDFFPSKGVTFVAVDCPTDQWGSSVRSADPFGCSDTYRSSEQHAADISQLIKHLKDQKGIERVFIWGHSYGSVSSRWLATRLGDQIQGSIHSASMSISGGGRFFDYGRSIKQMDMSKASAPWVFVHNESDACAGTAYAPIQAIAGKNLITVRGGIPEGDPCRAGHYHSYQGRELDALEAIADWMMTGKIAEFVGNP
ncbi:alpha/beta hydrolase [Limnohabitans sp. TEGF004]|jgi:pimeloyl-ACP methyl ester carboxylesterase|uniref:serine aminopeptidase domain-containing protein n=1 Tax=Limnohabitans sp. TEGF004 TaxID=2986281 RepID=UPI00249288EF|nr:alpha/beta hydrolase [Limnohabitans sp. TEGF004]